MSKKKKGKISRYGLKVARRRRAGTINYSLPVDSRGNPTLNRREMAYDGRTPRTRTFSRLARTDELN